MQVSEGKETKVETQEETKFDVVLARKIERGKDVYQVSCIHGGEVWVTEDYVDSAGQMIIELFNFSERTKHLLIDIRAIGGVGTFTPGKKFNIVGASSNVPPRLRAIDILRQANIKSCEECGEHEAGPDGVYCSSCRTEAKAFDLRKVPGVMTNTPPKNVPKILAAPLQPPPIIIPPKSQSRRRNTLFNPPKAPETPKPVPASLSKAISESDLTMSGFEVNGAGAQDAHTASAAVDILRDFVDLLSEFATWKETNYASTQELEEAKRIEASRDKFPVPDPAIKIPETQVVLPPSAKASTTKEGKRRSRIIVSDDEKEEKKECDCLAEGNPDMGEHQLECPFITGKDRETEPNETEPENSGDEQEEEDGWDSTESGYVSGDLDSPVRDYIRSIGKAYVPACDRHGDGQGRGQRTFKGGMMEGGGRPSSKMMRLQRQLEDAEEAHQRRKRKRSTSESSSPRSMTTKPSGRLIQSRRAAAAKTNLAADVMETKPVSARTWSKPNKKRRLSSRKSTMKFQKED